MRPAQRPFILTRRPTSQVTTNLGRSQVFGPYVKANPIYPDDIHEVYWTPLATASQIIEGLFLDNNGDIGATHSGPPGRPPNLTPPALPESDNEPYHILTTARLRGVKRVTTLMSLDEYARKVCGGMLMEYWDGSVSALGRWNPRLRSGVLEEAVVFDAEGGPPLGSLAFRHSVSEDMHCVAEVRGFARGERISVGDGWTVFDAEKDEVRTCPPGVPCPLLRLPVPPRYSPLHLCLRVLRPLN